MFDYYFSIIFFAVFLMIVLKVMVHYNVFLEPDQKQRLGWLSTLLIIAALSEFSGVYLDGTAAFLRPVHIAVKVTELSLAPVIPYLCASVIQKQPLPKLLRLGLCAHAALEVLSGLIGGIFYVDADNFYFHGPFYPVYVLAFLSGILFFIGIVLLECRVQYGIRRILLLFLPAFAIFGLLLQFVLSDAKVIWLCTSIDVLLMYVLYMELTQNIDPLTHLLNRQCYESRISRLREPVLIFYFDVDDFKLVNDTYGHSFGDLTLATAGECIQSVFGKAGECYRIGGDEFCAILSYDKFQPEDLLKEFLHSTETVRQKNRRFPYVSAGYAHFRPGEDQIADVVKTADTFMYLQKRNAKEKRAAAGAKSED